MEHKQLYIHIGYPKTATTTLQNHFFSEHPSINYLHDRDLKHISRFFFYERENAVKRNIKSINNNLQDTLKNFPASKSTFVFSSESLTSFSMFFRFNPPPFVWSPDPNAIARKLYAIFSEGELFDNVKIIVTIRKQDEMLKSMYAQVYNLVFKRFQQTKSFNAFLDYIFENKNNFIIDSLHYEDVVNTYQELFGVDNVKVLVYEELQNSPATFVRQLTEFLEIDFEQAYQTLVSKNENQRSGNPDYYPSDSRSIYEVASIYKNKWLGNTDLGLNSSYLYFLLKKVYLPGKKLHGIYIPEEYQSLLRSEFGEGNNWLAKHLKLPLGRYGYYGFDE